MTYDPAMQLALLIGGILAAILIGGFLLDRLEGSAKKRPPATPPPPPSKVDPAVHATKQILGGGYGPTDPPY